MKNIDKSIFAERLSKAIKNSGLTRKQLAEELGRGIDSIDGWCSRKKENYPSVDVMFTLCKILKVDFCYLVGLIDVPTHRIDEICKTTGLSSSTIEYLMRKEGTNEGC